MQTRSLRGKILHQAAHSLSGKMQAVYRLRAQAMEEIVGNLEPQGAIAIAAWNTPDHTTIVGEEELVAKAQLHAISLGAEVAAVDIAGPWHCRLAEHTAKRIGVALSDIRFNFPRVPIYMSSTGTPSSLHPPGPTETEPAAPAESPSSRNQGDTPGLPLSGETRPAQLDLFGS